MSDEKRGWWRHIFPPRTDFLQMLGEQASFAQKAVETLRRWSAGGTPQDLDEVLAIEQQSDVLREQLVQSLTAAFETPLDREDINDVSRRLDDVVDATRNVMRVIVHLHVAPDEHLRKMLTSIGEGLTHLAQGLQALPDRPAEAAKQADQARHSQRATEELEVLGLADVMEQGDPRHIFRQREAYQKVFTVGKLLEELGEDLMHAINKLG